MEKYIEQLINDIHKATWNIRPPHEIWEQSGADPDDELELEDISHVEEFVYEENCPFPGYCSTCKEFAAEMKCDEGIGDSDFDPPVDGLIDFEMINGFYDDDGNKIDPNSVPVPGLCIICKQYQLDDSEENLLCLMNRNDQRNELDFKCGAYAKI